MKKIIFSLFTLFSLSYASGGGCVLVQSGDMNVTWKAYKTLDNIEVKGAFTSVKYVPVAKEGKNFRELLVGSTLQIDTAKVDTGDLQMDDAFVSMCFKKFKATSIKAEITGMKADKRIKGQPYGGVLDVRFTINEKTLVIPMPYVYDKEKFIAKGSIDLFDFSGKESLSNINKECYDIQKGKTWNDLSIEFATHIKATLCKVK
jgi:hypothetical protein